MKKTHKEDVDAVFEALGIARRIASNLRDLQEFEMDEMPEFAQETAHYERLEEELDTLDEVVDYIDSAIDEMKNIKVR